MLKKLFWGMLILWGLAGPVALYECSLPEPNMCVMPKYHLPKEPEAPAKLVAHIRKVNPKADAVRLAGLIHKIAGRYHLNEKTFAAIIEQESSFEGGIKSCHGRSSSCDYGLGQINALWIEEMELDARRLRYDDEYNLDVAARILSDVIKRFGQYDPRAYSYYHDYRPEYRSDYEAMVEYRIRHMG